jgi:hypothetical protein
MSYRFYRGYTYDDRLNKNTSNERLYTKNVLNGTFAMIGAPTLLPFYMPTMLMRFERHLRNLPSEKDDSLY